MKNFILSTVVLAVSTVAVAAPKKEIIKGEGRISTYGLNCIVNLGGNRSHQNSERMYTQIDTRFQESIHVMGFDSKQMEVRHSGPAMMGCPVKKLDKLINDAAQFYAFAAVKVELTKELSASVVNEYSGECWARYTETLKLDFGSGIVLVSDVVEGRKADDCK